MTGEPLKPSWSANKVAGYLLAGVVVLAIVAAVTRHSPATPTGSASVVYQVSGSASTTDLTYTNAGGDEQQQSAVAVPIPDITLTLPHGGFAYIAAQNMGASGDITCRIVVDGTVVKETTSSGGYVIATCSATVP